MVRIGCLGDVSWKVVQRVAEGVRWMAADAPMVTIQPEEEVAVEMDPLDDSNHYQSPEDIHIIDTRQPGWDLLADEDHIWHEPSRQTLSILRRLLRGDPIK